VRDTVRAFDSAAAGYDDWYRHPQGVKVLKAELDAVERLIPSGGLGLELGAGTGVFAHGLTSPDRVIVCLDPSLEMISRAAGRGLPSVAGVGDHLPFRGESLDFTYMVAVLEFLGDPAAVFREVRAAAKAGSPLTVMFINPDSAWGRFYGEIGSKGDPVFRHARLRSLDEAEALLREAGYAVEETLGTLTTGPMEPDVGAELRIRCEGCGVVAVRARPVG
jgi:SAM-dependent methyltransferase